MDLLQEFERSMSVRRFTEEYGVGTTSVYGLKKQKDKLLKFYSGSDDHKPMKNRKKLA